MNSSTPLTPAELARIRKRQKSQNSFGVGREDTSRLLATIAAKDAEIERLKAVLKSLLRIGHLALELPNTSELRKREFGTNPLFSATLGYTNLD
jgi:hypothetical protein